MISKCKETIEEYNMISSGDKVYVAVSGGADSVCLLLVLEEIKKEKEFELEAIHVEHGIRGDESIKDALFVEDLCRKHGIKFHSYSVDSKKFAKEMIDTGIVNEIKSKKGNLRYEYFIPLDDEETILLIDSWENQEALDEHHKSDTMNKIMELRNKYDLHMKVERYTLEENNDVDKKYIKE